jgi:hypothetical protein
LEDNNVVELGLLAEKAMEKGTLVVRIVSGLLRGMDEPYR